MERKGFIGGSDCVKIMQGNWLELWQIKTGRIESDDLSRNIAVQLGSWTEDFNLEWFEHEHDCVLSNHQEELEDMIGTVPAKGMIDARWGSRIVEAKHTNPYKNIDDIIEYYMPQIQLYCYLVRCRWRILLSNLWQQQDGNQLMSRTITSISILCGQWCQTSGVTLYATKNRLVFKRQTSPLTRLRWTTWSSETPAQTTSLSTQQLPTSTDTNTTACSRTQRKISKHGR